MNGRRAGIYLRVSTGEQSTALQETELTESAERRGWEFKIYRDQGLSGAKQCRPGLEALLADMRRRRLDVVMVWSPDRLARSLKQLLSLAEDFRNLGVDLYSYKQAIDNSFPTGRLTSQMLGAVAEFEREMLKERFRAGLAQAPKVGQANWEACTPAFRQRRRQGDSSKIRLQTAYTLVSSSHYALCRGPIPAPGPSRSKPRTRLIVQANSSPFSNPSISSASRNGYGLAMGTLFKRKGSKNWQMGIWIDGHQQLHEYAYK